MKTLISSILQINKKYKTKFFVVGGYIRDLLMGRTIQDMDFVLDVNPKDFAKEVADNIKGNFVELDRLNQVYRVFTPEGLIMDFSKMKGDTIEEDLYHRDFSINAMAYDLNNGWPIDEKLIIDWFDGRKDIEAQKIRHLKNSVFSEDPIRMLRAVRLMVQLKFNIDTRTIKLIQDNAPKISLTAGERITEELFKILKAENSYFYLNYMDETLQLLDKIFPDLVDMKEVGECKYHVVDSWTHSIFTVKVAEGYINSEGFFEEHIRQVYEDHTSKVIAGNRTRLDLIKLGALFHDIGKPSARKIDETGRVRFRGHEITGAEILKGYAEKLKLSVKERDILYRYVAYHMLPLDSYKKNDVSGKALYEIFTKMGEETLDILLIALSDIVATRKLLVPEEEMGMFKVHIEYIANNYLTRYRPIENIQKIVTGRDIMEHLELPQGVLVGELLEEIKKAIFYGKISATKEAALKYVKQIYKEDI
ncbi:CCA tRNA nucleotidyltransferase [Alkaliphilus hydrothermalis]|uniref:Poly(A) polymerase n=1 Tax=Alkaliphilus hydrothermalis TaxID=1482730 RepID=A0ABS2NPK6_9FIRM|nr:HDIG domain-containing metalloprotein [Alkaliphilus hydrothermalis]MBM7614747.1 poly(A) polymerase [Alkaliphilus hydrothermalis]